MSKEESVATIIMKQFPGLKIIEWYSVLGKRIDLYHKLALEIDEEGHMDRKKKKEKEERGN